MVSLTLLIGVVNLCLGYAVAAYLGYGPPGPTEAWEAMMADPAGVREEDPIANQELSSTSGPATPSRPSS